MSGRLIARMDATLSSIFPERRLIIRSESSARYLRLSPRGQAVGMVVAFALLSWSAMASLMAVGASFSASSANHRITLASDAYRTEIAALTAAKIALADDLSDAEARSYLALSRLSDQHAVLSSSIAEEEELASALMTHRARIEGASDASVETVAMCDASTNRLTALEVKLLQYERENASLNDALAALTNTLDDVAGERDVASETTHVLTARLDSLSAEIVERSERQNRMLSQLESAASVSLGSLEGVFEKSGIKLDPILNEVRREFLGEGGPFLPMDDHSHNDQIDDETPRVAALIQDLERVNLLRLAAEQMPFAKPVHAARFTSGFGGRRDPINGRRSFHEGQDFAGPRGTPIYTTGHGTVVSAGRKRGYGNVVKIRHAFGYETVYAHLHKIRVKVGEVVERGDRIGDMGNTGRSTGTHLHYEIRIGGKPVNPATYIEAARNVL
ncbi:MAG: DUF5930 domain-containing protein [Pseudomonadota bacterium]